MKLPEILFTSILTVVDTAMPVIFVPVVFAFSSRDETCCWFLSAMQKILVTTDAASALILVMISDAVNPDLFLVATLLGYGWKFRFCSTSRSLTERTAWIALIAGLYNSKTLFKQSYSLHAWCHQRQHHLRHNERSISITRHPSASIKKTPTLHELPF